MMAGEGTAVRKRARTVSDYVLRDIDHRIWAKAKARAALEERSIKEILIRFLDQYGSRKRPEYPATSEEHPQP